MISIIIPAYNASATLRRCLDSIINQSYKDFEVIVVDDGSTDETYSIMESYAKTDNRFILIRKSNGGVSSARNCALYKAKGEYIAFCDTDDEVNPHWLKDFIDNINGVDIVVQDLMNVDSNGNCNIPNLHLNYGPVSCEELLIKIHEVGLIGYLFTKLFRHDIISKNNLKFREDIHCREDEVFFLQYMEHAKTCFFVPIANYIYYLPASAKIYKSSFTQAVDDLFRSLNRIYHGDLPVEICRCQAWCVKGACVDRLLAGERLSDELIDVYRQVFIDTLKGEDNRLISWLIINSSHLGKIPNIIIKLINRIHH